MTQTFPAAPLYLCLYNPIFFLLPLSLHLALSTVVLLFVAPLSACIHLTAACHVSRLPLLPCTLGNMDKYCTYALLCTLC